MVVNSIGNGTCGFGLFGCQYQISVLCYILKWSMSMDLALYNVFRAPEYDAFSNSVSVSRIQLNMFVFKNHLNQKLILVGRLKAERRFVL